MPFASEPTRPLTSEFDLWFSSNQLTCRMEYKEALKRGLYDFEIARNWYRSVSSPENGGAGMHHDLVFTYIKNAALLIAPFTPHYSEHIYKNVLGETGSIQNAAFPRASSESNPAVLAQLEYMRGVVDSIRSAEAQLSKKKTKGKTAGAYDPSKPKAARVYVAAEFPEWQNKCVEVVRKVYDEQTGKVDEAALKKESVAAGLVKDKKAMPFIQLFKVSRGGGDTCQGSGIDGSAETSRRGV
jgi:leucyl-tRNA synthetase